MKAIETILSIGNVFAFLAVGIPWPRAARWVRHGVPVVGLVAVAQVFVEGARWPMVPAYVLSGLFCLAWLWKSTAPTGRSAGRRPNRRRSVALGILGLSASIALPAMSPGVRFPPPSGPYEIGTVTYHWTDADRREVFDADPDARRELMVQIWYPAMGEPSSPRAPYAQDGRALASALSRLHHIPAFVFANLSTFTTNAIPFARVSDKEPRYPVLVFLEGLAGIRQMNTFQVEELVSQGYVVVAVDQPFTAALVVFPDGRQAAGLSKDQADGLIQQSIRPASRAPRLHGPAFEDGIVPYLARDVTFTLDQLTRLNQPDADGLLAGRLDLQRVGIFGVSLGGIVGSEACRVEPRLRACLVMDAPMPAAVVRAGLRQPSMWITRDAETMRLEGWAPADVEQHQTTMRAVFERLPGDGYFVQVRGMYHANLTDTPTWSPLFSRLGVTGPLDERRAHRLINAYSVAFFDRHLRGRSAALLDGAAEQPPEVLLETGRP